MHRIVEKRKRICGHELSKPLSAETEKGVGAEPRDVGAQLVGPGDFAAGSRTRWGDQKEAQWMMGPGPYITTPGREGVQPPVTTKAVVWSPPPNQPRSK